MSRLLITRLNRLSLLSTQLRASPPNSLSFHIPKSLLAPSLISSSSTRLFHHTPAPQKPENTMGSVGAIAPTAAPRGLPEFSLQGKIIVVSGGGRGLGLTQAEGLLEAGAVVHVIDRLEKPSDEFYKIAARAKGELGTALHYHRADVRDQANLNVLVESIAEQHGHIDGLLAAAGIQQETPALEYTAEDCDRMLGVNVTGVFMTAQAVARQMIRLKCTGGMVLIASMSGTVANRGLICPAYNASKAAVIQLARNLASEWGQHGIRVNTISPGYIVTAMTAGLFETYPERREDWPKANMLNRLSVPEDYRGSAVFLLSEASSFMTGADLRIDGGHCAW